MSTFGPNSAYINELYYEYLKNPSAFDETWRSFFSTYDPGSIDEIADLGVNGSNGVHAAPAPVAPAPKAQASNGNGVSAQPAPAAQPARQEPPKAPAAQQQGSPTPIPEGGKQLTSVALRIAQNMEQSLTVPTATSFREIPVKVLEENRTLINGYLKASDSGKLSFTHIIGWAIVKALGEYPSLNNAFQVIDGKSYLIQRPDVNLGLAIDLERPDGGRSLVVPNIKKANQMDFRAFYETYESIVRKARDNKLSPDDFSGTTISLTNPGTIGTIASVPRLMVGQGTIIATGAINYPAAYQAMDAETLSELGISKVMEITSTYDHRIIQGAESGLFLNRMQELLMGESGFYEEIYRSLKVPFRPLSWQRDRHTGLFGGGDRAETFEKQQNILKLINNYRVRGHLQAYLDPLGTEPQYHSDLDPATFGLSIWDFDRVFSTGGLAGLQKANLRTILSILRDTYTQRIGVEYMHIQDPEEKTWLQERMESGRNQPTLTPEQRRRVLRKLSEAEVFEKFLQTKYTGHKRFSLEGAETMIPMLDELVTRAAGAGVQEIILGMAHRGRLNVLANELGKSPQKIFEEFEDIHDPSSFLGSGDVKYHLGARGSVVTDEGTRINLWMAPNPSHLEAVDPVVEGMVRARQDRTEGDRFGRYVPLLIHGDAAFAGQGVVAETLNLSQLEGYGTGGTIHIVVNNQIGFTAAPRDTRSMLYATDVAKMVQAPIFHVNGDDPEAAAHVMRLAFEYRQRFHRDVVIDLFCYRRYGHNETDEPSYTNPLLYRKIRAHAPTHTVYTERLLRNRTLTKEQVEEIESEFKNRLEGLLAATKAQVIPAQPEDPLEEQRLNPVDTWTNPQTGIPEFMLEHIVNVLSSVPQGIEVHPKLVKQVEGRARQAVDGKIDWALAEALAFGSLLLEGHPVRLSGQDSERGTFSQRHSVLHDQSTDEVYVPLRHLSDMQAPFYVYDSALSEYAVLGFEYGYSVTDPESLVLWEAQFGDFVNGAQIVIDQFISSSEDKWGQTCSLVMLLPHGFEGQGPEHSSARLERFLTLCAEDNMQVVVPTTPAQYFHVLRRQMKREVRKPLVILSPKSLLRHPMVVSSASDLTGGTFRTVLPEADPIQPENVRRVVFCFGKVYYDLLQARRKAEQNDVAIIRVEQLYPFPSAEVRAQLELYSHAKEIVWVQEEPKNMGAWPTVSHWIREVLHEGQRLRFLGRPASGSPAAGSARRHNQEQAEIVRRALGLSPDESVKTIDATTRGVSKMPES
jgi:2-oxoglutarate dehydrogenase E1 component